MMKLESLKQQINDLYSTLIEQLTIWNLKIKEILKLEKLKYDFLKVHPMNLKPSC